LDEGKDFVSVFRVQRQWRGCLQSRAFWEGFLEQKTADEMLSLTCDIMESTQESFCFILISIFNQRFESREKFYSLPPVLFQNLRLINVLLKHCWMKVKYTSEDLTTLFLALKILSRENKNLLEEGKGKADELILMAMLRYQNDQDLQREACGAIWNLAYNDDLRQNIIQRGGTELILQTLRNFSEVRLITKAAGALSNLIVAENAQMIIERGGIELILNFMKQNPTFLELQQCASSAFINLFLLFVGDRRLIQQKLVDGGMIEAFLQAMVLHPQDMELNQNACELLHFLSRENRERIIAAKGISIIRQARKSHPECRSFLCDLQF